jgi:hypothetical protein
MRNAIKKKSTMALSALAAAGFGAWAGAPAARGDFSFFVNGLAIGSGFSASGNSSAWAVQPQSSYSPLNYVSDGTTYSVFVFSAQNLGTSAGQVINTGTFLEGLNVTIDTGGPSTFGSTAGALGIDIQQNKTTLTANVDGTTAANSPTPGVQADNGNAAFVPTFGDIAGGTFVGVSGAGPWTSNLVNDDNNGENTVGGTQAVFINAQTTEYTPFNDVKGKTSGAVGVIDPQFITPADHPGTSSTVGTVDNGTIHSLQVESLANDGPGGVEILDNFAGGLPFANVVVPFGTTFTIHGGVGGDIGSTYFFGQVLTAGTVQSVSSLSISLTGTVPSSSNLIAALTIHGANGLYNPVTTPVTGAGQTKGYTTVTGFSPNNDAEIYGLDATGETSLTTLIADLQTALNTADPGATAEAPTGSAAGILTAAGDNVELVFPNTTTPSTSPAVLAFDLSNYTANGTVTITSITVIPEPTSLGMLVLGGAGLLSRKRRRKLA